MIGRPLRIAAFGFRSIPPTEGSAGADKFALELCRRLVQKGHEVTAYNRVYESSDQHVKCQYDGIRIVNLRTVRKKGFDTLFHSFKTTLHIILTNSGEVVHIHNGGNSIWAILLRTFGKRVYVSQDGVDWKRKKWPWYGRVFLYLSSYITAYLPDRVIFDNIFAKELFEEKFSREFEFIPYGSEVNFDDKEIGILQKLNLHEREYFLFIGRFIPDKGIHYLIKAFEQVTTTKRLVIVGGSPNPSRYESDLRSTEDKRIIFPGYIYGDDANVLIKYAFAYIQPSDIEGLSPLILTVMGIGTPLICSDIKENEFIARDNAVYFQKGDTNDLKEKIEYAIKYPSNIGLSSMKGKNDIIERFSWETVTNQYIRIFDQQC